MSDYRLANAYLAIRVDAPVAASIDASGTLEERLADCVVRAAAAHPRLDVDPVTFVEFLAERTTIDRAEPHLDDLYLACAVALQTPGAAERLEELCISQLPRALVRIDRSAAFIAEIEQRIRWKMLVGNDGHPRIAEYRARGTLSAFIRVAAIREALMEKRSAGRRPLDELDDDAATTGDIELELVQREHGGQFEAALGAALAGLDRRERTALRLNYLDNLSIDQIGRHFHVHRATAARWISRAQTRVRDTTRQLMQERLRLSDSEAASLVYDLAFTARPSGMIARSISTPAA